MVTFYTKFCKNFAEIAALLTKLTNTKIQFQWTEVCQKALTELESLLSSHARLESDASALGMGSVLLQEDAPGVYRPIA